MEKRKCRCCRRVFIPIRNPYQSYCGHPRCQNTRKNRWRRQKQKDDIDYQENKKRALQDWLSRNPNYWQHYRNTHPDYKEHNRQQQRIRDQRKKRKHYATRCDLAKSDTLDEKTVIKTGTYKLIPDLAKSDALTVKISLISYD